MMPTEDDLKRMFESVDAPGGAGGSGGIDATRVIRRSRARRLPKQLAAGAGGALVLAGVTVLGVQSTQLGTSTQDTALAPMSEEYSDQGGAGDAQETEISAKRAPANLISPCGAPLTDVAPSQFGLVLDVVFPATAPAASGRIEGTVVMTNTSAEPVRGTTYTVPAVILSQDGIVVWHTNGAVDANAIVVDLEPGASMQYSAWFEPVRCTADDETFEAFPAGLPPAGAGSYELSAAIDFAPDVPTATTELDLVTGPRMPIVLE